MQAVIGIPLPKIGNPLRRINLNLRASLAAIACACLMVVTAGCTSAQVRTAVQDIANAIPNIQPYLVTAEAVAATLDPAAAPLITVATALVQTSLTELQVLLNAYLASPSPSAWGAIVDAINTIVNSNANALLDAAHIVDPLTRARAVAVMGAIQTALLLVYSIVQRVHDTSTQTQIKAQAAARTVKLSQIKDYLDKGQIETATGHSFAVAYQYETAQGF